MTRAQFGWIMPSGTTSLAGRDTYVDDVDRALRLIDGSLQSAWMEDHLQIEGAREEWNPDQLDLVEGWTSLTYFAARHPGLQFGHAVLCQSYRNPALVAKMAATLQYLTRDRYTLGLGAGWHAHEYHAYGYDFRELAVRSAQLEEALRIIAAMWDQEPASVDGQYYSAESAFLSVHPATRPQLLIAGKSPRLISLAARYADCWDAYQPTPQEYAELAAMMDRACLDIGRDPRSIRRSCWFELFSCDSREQSAIHRAGSQMQRARGFVGTPEQVIGQLMPFVELGVDRFEIGCSGFPDLTSLEALISDVLPALGS